MANPTGRQGRRTTKGEWKEMLPLRHPYNHRRHLCDHRRNPRRRKGEEDRGRAEPRRHPLMPRPEGPLFEILRGDPVHPVLELVNDLVFRGLFHRFFEDYAGLLYDFVGGEDLCPRADGEGYGVRRPGVDLHRLALYLEPYGGEERRVPKFGNRDPLHRAAKLVDEAEGEVVGQGPDELLILKLEQDRAGLSLADPDRQIAVLVL